MTIVQSTGFVLIGKIIAAISAVPDLQQLPLVRNPRRAQDLDKGNRLIIVQQQNMLCRPTRSSGNRTAVFQCTPKRRR